MRGREDIEALIGRAQAGEVRAFEELVSAHLPVLRRYASAFSGGRSDADDLAQEALIKAWRSLRLFRYQSSFRTWLYTVVRSVYLDAAKSRRVRERVREVGLDSGVRGVEGDAVPAADHLLLREEERRRVWRALAEVPVEFRTALVLFDIEGCTYDEVAQIEDVAVGTVKSRLSRGRAHLARILGSGEETAAIAAGDMHRAGTRRSSLSSQGDGSV